MKSAGWILVGFLWVAFFLNYVDRQAAFSIFPALQTDLGFSSLSLGLVGTVFLWTYSAGMIMAGRLADKLPRRSMIVASLVLWSLAMLGTARSESPTEFLVWRAAMGLTESLYFPAAMALIASFHSGRTRSRAFAVHHSAQLAGSAAGGWFGGWSADRLGWRSGFAGLAWAGVLYAGALYFAFRYVVPTALPSENAGTSSGIPATKVSPAEVLRDRRLQVLAAAFFCFCGVLWMIYAWFPHHLYQRHNLSMTRAGFIATVYLQCATFAGMMTGGYLGDTWSRIRVTSLGLLGSPVFAFAMFAAPELPLGIGAAVGFGLTAGLFQANVFSLAFDWIDEQNRGFATGVLNAMGGLAGGAGMLAAGLYRDTFGMTPLIGIGAAATFLGGTTLMMISQVAGVRKVGQGSGNYD